MPKVEKGQSTIGLKPSHEWNIRVVTEFGVRAIVRLSPF
jgi:hypothetical protein